MDEMKNKVVDDAEDLEIFEEATEAAEEDELGAFEAAAEDDDIADFEDAFADNDVQAAFDGSAEFMQRFAKSFSMKFTLDYPSAKAEDKDRKRVADEAVANARKNAEATLKAQIAAEQAEIDEINNRLNELQKLQ